MSQKAGDQGDHVFSIKFKRERGKKEGMNGGREGGREGERKKGD
jgi:hypothetical protein